MVKLAIKNGFFGARIAATGFPANDGFGNWSENEAGAGNFDLLAFGARSLNGNSLRRIDIDLGFLNLKFQTVHQPVGSRQDEAVAAIVLQDAQFVLKRDVELTR